MKAMFSRNSSLEYLDLSKFDTTNVTNMDFMFSQCFELKEKKGINNFNTNNVINMKSMFQECKELNYLDLSNFNTSHVTDMGKMFSGCIGIFNIRGINKITTLNFPNLKAIFEKCESLFYLDLSNLNTSNVAYMGWMFDGCLKLKEIQGIKNFNTNKVINMTAMFQNCIELEYLDLSNFNTSNIIDMQNMFFNSCNLKEIKGINNF